MKKILGTFVLILILVNQPPIDGKAEATKRASLADLPDVRPKPISLDSLYKVISEVDSIQTVIDKSVSVLKHQQAVLLND